MIWRCILEGKCKKIDSVVTDIFSKNNSLADERVILYPIEIYSVLIHFYMALILIQRMLLMLLLRESCQKMQLEFVILRKEIDLMWN